MWRFPRFSASPVALCCVSLVCGAFVSCAPKGIEGLLTRSYAGGQQQEGKIAYAENPPLGGAYSPLWQKCGAYTAPLYDEYAVHSLERGAVWVVYSPALPAAEVSKLKSALSGYASWLLSPRAGLPGPLVVSAWNAQVQASGAEDERVAAFLERYAQPLQPGQNSKGAQASTAPEQTLGCAGGYSGTQ
jgi:hypothetical protein